MKEQRLKNILDFLNDWPTDESVSSPFVNNIKNGRYSDDVLDYLPTDDKFFVEFWSRHIASYLHFYVYTMMHTWISETSSDTVLQREKSYVNHFFDTVVEEMNGLLLHLCNEKCSKYLVVKEFVEHSINSFFEEFIGNGLLLVTICKNEGLGALGQKYFSFLYHHLESTKPQILLSSLSYFLSSYTPNEYNTLMGRSVLKIIVNKLAENYSISDFNSISNKLCDNAENWEDTICQLKESISNCVRYYDASKFSIDDITLGFTKFKDALVIKEKSNVKGDYSYFGRYIEYKGASINFEDDYDDKENGKCCRIHLNNGYSNKEYKHALNYFLGILFNISHFDYEILSYNDFLKYLKVHHFFELQRFHKRSKDSNWYSAKWRQVNNSHVCDFIFSIDGEYGMDAEDVKNIKDITIQLDIYINDNRNQDELYKTEPIPSLDSDYSDTSSSFKYDGYDPWAVYNL